MKYYFLLLTTLIFVACQRETSNTTGWQGGGKGRVSRKSAACYAYGSSSTGAPAPSSGYASMPDAGEAGKITAGEVNDLSEWDFWEDLPSDQLAAQQDKWQLNPSNRVTVLVQNEEFAPLNGAKVTLYGPDKRGNAAKQLWSSHTDNTGVTHLFGTLSSADTSDVTLSKLTISYQGQTQTITDIQRFSEGINLVTFNAACNESNAVDIAFAVDATGSMQDEIDFLKKDLLDIIESSAGLYKNVDLNLASLFYRCEGNSYVTKHSDFSPKLEKTLNFIKDQNADEGGDEVVAKALDESINKLSWREDARVKLLFIVLDEPPGSTEEVNEAMKQVYRDAAEKGIKIIPCVASGTNLQVDRSLEYLMRSAAIATNGTYVFFTNDSGIGNDHTLPIVKSYEVEKLNALLKRIISANLETTPCEKQDGPTATTIAEQNNLQEQTGIVMDSLMALGSDSLIMESLLAYTNFQSVEELDSNRPLDQLDTTKLLQDFQKEVVSMKVFPIPTVDNITVEITQAPDSYALLDGHGRVLLHNETTREKTFVVDLSTLPRGNYFVKAVVGETVLTSKIIKL